MMHNHAGIQLSPRNDGVITNRLTAPTAIAHRLIAAWLRGEVV
jgi:hypothetical protein